MDWIVYSDSPWEIIPCGEIDGDGHLFWDALSSTPKKKLLKTAPVDVDSFRAVSPYCLCATTGISTTFDKLHLRHFHKNSPVKTPARVVAQRNPLVH